MLRAVLLAVGFIQAADTSLLTLLRHFSNTSLPAMSSLSAHSLFSCDFRLLSQLPSPSRRHSSTLAPLKFIDLCVCARRLTLFISAIFAMIRRCRTSTVQAGLNSSGSPFGHFRPRRWDFLDRRKTNLFCHFILSFSTTHPSLWCTGSVKITVFTRFSPCLLRSALITLWLYNCR